MSDPMPFRSMSVSESEVRRALVSMTAERDALKAALTDADDALNMIDGDTQETFIQKQALAARSRIAAALGKEQP